VITPALSVLSAIEGIKLVTDSFEPYGGTPDGTHPVCAVCGSVARHGGASRRSSGR